MTTQEIIEVVKAYEEGKTIECKVKGQNDSNWAEAVKPPLWNFGSFDYRVKKNPTRLDIVNKFWEETFGISDRFDDHTCPSSSCAGCPLTVQYSGACMCGNIENWWNKEYKGAE